MYIGIYTYTIESLYNFMILNARANNIAYINIYKYECIRIYIAVLLYSIYIHYTLNMQANLKFGYLATKNNILSILFLL